MNYGTEKKAEDRMLKEHSSLEPEGTSLNRKLEEPVHGWNAHHTG